MSAVLSAIEAGHIAAWGLAPAAMSVHNAMKARRKIPLFCKACGEGWVCTTILTARLEDQKADRKARNAQV